MTILTAGKPGQSWYGETIGILILEALYPCEPGNVGNATTYNFPVRYQNVQGASIDRLLNQADPALREAFVAAAHDLQCRGVKAITGACGFMALFQEDVQSALDIPVFLSSLMQIPFIYQITKRPVGIMTANAQKLEQRHFRACGITPEMPVIIQGMQDYDEFRSAILEEKGTLDTALIEEEVADAARKLKSNSPGIGAILLECSDLPPYAWRVHQETGLPVFDFVTMINHVAAAVNPQPYFGRV